jgi:hypothetical protein
MATTDSTTLNYIVTEFDQQHLVILVDFPNDGTKANIQLTTIPETQEDLDQIVKPFATHEEVVTALATTEPASLAFIEGVVGKTNTTTRFSAADYATATAATAAATAATQATAAALPSNELVIGTVLTPAQQANSQANNKAADLQYIKELIAEAVAGMTPAQLVAAATPAS